MNKTVKQGVLKQGNGQPERIARTIIGGRWTIKGGGSDGLAHLLIIADYYSQNDDSIKCREKNATDYFFVSWAYYSAN